MAISDNDVICSEDCTDARKDGVPTIYVCITCRGPDGILRDPLPGEVLAVATIEAARGRGVKVRPIRCLANCSRGPSAALRADGSWTYVFGGLDASTAPALVIGARMLAEAENGILPWRGRPQVLKRGLCARTPPIDFTEPDCKEDDA
ncbi:MAG TPA: DUF1636 domain-containing protein [Xanthobacteraceae bacterium]|nr:DUF1636 domain-containing protein [Xanthobacteraceae bacterium]